MKKIFTLLCMAALVGTAHAQKITSVDVTTKAELTTAINDAATLSAGDIAYNTIKNCKGHGISLYHGTQVGKITHNTLDTIGGKNNGGIGDYGITVNGTSLTVCNSERDSFEVAIIPYTHELTNFHNIVEGTVVNLEFDIIGKYLALLMEFN